jgi:hypothetical protein
MRKTNVGYEKEMNATRNATRVTTLYSFLQQCEEEERDYSEEG